MFTWLLIASALSASSNVQPTETKLQGLSPGEANALIAKLQQAQMQLKAGKNETFELLAGAPAGVTSSQMLQEFPVLFVRELIDGGQSAELFEVLMPLHRLSPYVQDRRSWPERLHTNSPASCRVRDNSGGEYCQAIH